MVDHKQICYVMPYTENFREERPRLCWEFMYGWIDGYGVCFDPVIQSGRNKVPVFSNGAPENISGDMFYITSSREATKEFHPENVSGLFLCPDKNYEIRPSMKERLRTPVGTFFYPARLSVIAAEGNDPAWMLGENVVLNRNAEQIELYFELYSMIGFQIQEFPHKRLIHAGNMLAAILQRDLSDFDRSTDAGEFRLDCQSFGITRLFLQWTLRLLGEDPEQVAIADSDYLNAVHAYKKQDLSGAVDSLSQAFRKLYQLRTKYIPLDFQIAEYPHAGILLPESGFFELEWPEGSRGVISAHLNDVERNRYAASFELSGADWSQLNARFPGMVKRIGRLWNEEKIELTNGTWSLPYAFVSPMNLQYFQFRCGQEAFRSVFGRVPELYECQENSLTPQMPDLLVHFGYKRVIHSAQNHGTPRYEKEPQIRWESPSGSGLHALTASGPEQVKLGLNFFLDLPLQFVKYKDRKSIYSFNFMDLGYIPYRECTIRAARYAPVFGRFILGSSLFSDGENLPVKTYSSDDYNFSSDAFYRNYTNRDSLSHFEHIFQLSAEWRALQLISPDVIAEEPQIARLLCTIEAHDCDRVQGQRPGEFYISRINEPSPTSRLELRDVITGMRAKLRTIFDAVYERTVPEKTEQLFNASEVTLAFAEVKYPEKFSGELFRFGGKNYASGNFAPFHKAKTNTIPGETKISNEYGKVGNWLVQVQNDKIVVEKSGEHAVFVPVDLQQGAFALQSAEYRTQGEWLTVRLIFMQSGKRLETVILEGITTADANYIEWNLRYAAQDHFNEEKRWEDYLALSFEKKENAVLRNFVPSMMCETKEDHIISSNCLEIADEYSLLFTGAGNFVRGKDQLHWLFHVASETVYERKLILSFGNEVPALLSRGLQSGLIPVAEIPDSFPVLSDGTLSLECRIGKNQWLVSNLSAEKRVVTLPENTSLISMEGNAITNSTLAPWQVAILKVN